MVNWYLDEEVDDDEDYEDDDDYGLQEEGDDDDNCHDDDGMDEDSEYIEEEGDIELYSNQYRGTYIDYMVDESDDDRHSYH